MPRRRSYNPFENRNVEHPTSTLGSFIHLLKSSLGTGLLAMPLAFKNSGLLAGAIGTVLVGCICTYCVHLLVKTSREVCTLAKMPSMGYAKTAGAVFQFGPEKCRKWSVLVSHFVDYGLAATYLATLCVYIVFIAQSFKDVFDEYSSGTKLPIQAYCFIPMIPLLLMCQIKNLKFIVPFSATANILLIVCFIITMYYVFIELPSPKDRQMVASVAHWPLFMSTVIFAMEGIGVVMPLENDMANPRHFLGCPGVLNIAMGIVIFFYCFVGFFGYLKYGEAVEGSITLSLPSGDILAQAVKFLMALSVLFTYTLQFYVPMEMIWRKVNAKIDTKRHNIAQIGIRSAIVIGSVVVAVIFPDLELVINVCGAIFFSSLGLLTPAVIDTVHHWSRGFGPLKWRLWKNVIIGFISLLALFAGTITAIKERDD